MRANPLAGEPLRFRDLALVHLARDFHAVALGIVVAASQAVFSEQVVSRWLRLEWLRMRFEKTYDDVYRLFHSRPAVPKFNAMTLESLGMYETAKANGAITLSSRLFHQLNAELSIEWERIKVELKI